MDEIQRTKPPKDYASTVPFPEEVVLRPIGRVHSPYVERFGTPRQATVLPGRGHSSDAEAVIELFADRVPLASLKDLEGFERLWVIAHLHLNSDQHPVQVRPPRQPEKRGLMATRAPHRPNNLGLSAVRLLRVEGHRLHVHGIDLLDGTPVLDVKPYVPYCDAFPEASAGWVDEAIRSGT